MPETVATYSASSRPCALAAWLASAASAANRQAVAAAAAGVPGLATWRDTQRERASTFVLEVNSDLWAQAVLARRSTGQCTPVRNFASLTLAGCKSELGRLQV